MNLIEKRVREAGVFLIVDVPDDIKFGYCTDVVVRWQITGRGSKRYPPGKKRLFLIFLLLWLSPITASITMDRPSHKLRII